MSRDRKLILLGTAQISPRVLLWDLCSKTLLNSLTLEKTVYIH